MTKLVICGWMYKTSRYVYWYGQFCRVGSYAPVKVDLRIMATTHQNLELCVQEDCFRKDLFHCLNVIRVRLPPLREQQEDIHRLVWYFLQVAATELGVESKNVHPETETALTPSLERCASLKIPAIG